MKIYLIEYAIALAAFLALDFLWLKSMGPTFYAQELGALLRPVPNLGVALGFYTLFVVGLVVFVIHPAVAGDGLAVGLARGALFGLVAYATYDLTNLATISGFSTRVAIVDMAWGAFLSAAVTAITVPLVKRFVLA